MNTRPQINYYTDKLDLEKTIRSIDFSRFDESVYICNLKTIVDKFHVWQKYMPNIKPHYAVKCNNDPLVLKTLANLGCGFDCASKNEIKAVLDLNVQPDRILYAQPSKMITHLKYAKENRVDILTVDNELEMYKIHKYYPYARLVIRFRSDAKKAIPLGVKFGCDPYKEAPALMYLAKKLHLNIIGVSFHVGSNCYETEAYDRAITVAKHLYQFGLLIGYKMKFIDIGGGFPGHDDEIFETVAKAIQNSLAYNFPDNYDDDDAVEIIAEPGSFFVIAAYTLVCKIIGKRVMKCEMDKQHRIMYYLNDGCFGSFKSTILHSDHVFITIKHLLDEKKLKKKKYKTILWGPTCDSLDKIIGDVYLPELNCDDLLYFPDMGAYTVALTTTFNGFPKSRILYFLQQKQQQ